MMVRRIVFYLAVVALLISGLFTGLWCYHQRIRPLPNQAALQNLIWVQSGSFYFDIHYCGSDEKYHYLLWECPRRVLNKRYRMPVNELVVISPFPRTSDKTKFISIFRISFDGQLDAKERLILNPIRNHAALQEMFDFRKTYTPPLPEVYYCGSDADYHYIMDSWRGGENTLYYIPTNELEVIGAFPRTRNKSKFIIISDLGHGSKIDATAGVVIP